MDRRTALVFGFATSALAVQAQARKARIGVLIGASSEPSTLRNVVEPLRQGLRELGYVEGKNFEIVFRFADGQPERLPGLAAELLALDLDVLVAAGPGPASAAKSATTRVATVAAAVNDPVETGLAQRMAWPGGNITGISSWGVELVAKRLQLLKELVPGARRVGVLANPHSGAFEEERGAATLAGFERALGMTIVVAKARGPDEFEAAFAMLARERVDGLVVLADSAFSCTGRGSASCA